MPLKEAKWVNSGERETHTERSWVPKDIVKPLNPPALKSTLLLVFQLYETVSVLDL